MLAVLVTALAAFVLIIVFLAWYAKWAAHRIFGNMNARLNGILDESKAPDEWHKKLRKVAGGKQDERKKKKAFNKYLRYVEASYKDLYSYAEKTAFIQDDARPDVLAALERFMDDYRESLKNSTD